MSVERPEDIFLRLGFDYYVAARFAARAGLLPVSGNLFHHAIEMFLKAWLSRTLDLAELKKLGHRLDTLWDRFKADFPQTELGEFHDTIAALHDFERIRYPEDILKMGAGIVIDWNSKSHTSGSTQVPHYGIVVHDIDRLVSKILEICSRNKKYFFNKLNEPARDALTFDNPISDWAD